MKQFKKGSSPFFSIVQIGTLLKPYTFVNDGRLQEERVKKGVVRSSSPGEFHPQALTDPDVTVSRHPALIIQLPSIATLPYLLAPPITG
jgi:hypothetical protein